jgi:hypothetical protein
MKCINTYSPTERECVECPSNSLSALLVRGRLELQACGHSREAEPWR